MDIRPLSPAYAVSPQIGVGDIPKVVAAGFTTVICNRPDAEVAPDAQSSAIRRAAEHAGLTFVFLPVTHQTLDAAAIDHQRAAMAASGGPVLAYCASGTRCSILWSFSQATEITVDEILRATTGAGYDLSGLRDQLAHFANA